MADSVYKNLQTSAEFVRQGQQQYTIWVPYKGLVRVGTAALDICRMFCTVTNVPPIVQTLLNENSIQTGGKAAVYTNTGREIPETEVEFLGNSVGVPAAFIGQNLATTANVNFDGDKGEQGALMIYNYSQDTGVSIRMDVVFDVSVKLLGIPGMTADGMSTQSVVLYSKTPTVVSLPEGYWMNVEVIYDNGTITSAYDPDGTTVDTFTNGTGNESYSTPPTPPTAIDTGLSTTEYTQYFYKIMTDDAAGGAMTDVDPAEISSYNATSFTFGSFPASQTKILWFYQIALATDNAAHIRADDTVRSLFTGWEKSHD